MNRDTIGISPNAKSTISFLIMFRHTIEPCSEIWSNRTNLIQTLGCLNLTCFIFKQAQICLSNIFPFKIFKLLLYIQIELKQMFDFIQKNSLLNQNHYCHAITHYLIWCDLSLSYNLKIIARSLLINIYNS